MNDQTTSRSRWRGALFALSLGHAAFAPSLAPQAHYFHEFSVVPYVVAAIDIAAWGLIVWLIWSGAARARSPAAKYVGDLAVIACFLLTADYLRQQTDPAFPGVQFQRWLGFSAHAAHVVALTIGALVAIALVAAPASWRRLMRNGVETVGLVLVPWAALSFGRVVWTIATDPRPKLFFPTSDTAARMERRDGPRVLVLVFDMFDERLAFVDRPTGIDLPTFDSLRAHSFSATSATTPGGVTAVAMPGIINGTRLAAVRIPAHGQLELINPDGSTALWRADQSVFAAARGLGAKTGLVGYYHPYCLILSSALDRCWTEEAHEAPSVRMVLRLARDPMKKLFRAVPPPNSIEGRESHSALLNSELSVLPTFLQDTSLRLLFVHFPVPHQPWIYDPPTHPLDGSDWKWGYYDNLKLSDRILTSVLRTIKDSPGEKPIVIVTADHSYARSILVDGRRSPTVPLLVAFPGGDTATYTKDVNTQLLKNAIVEMLRGRIASASQMGAWLDSR